MTEQTLKNLENLFMPRKSYDLFRNVKDVKETTDILTERLLENINRRYPNGEKWLEMDKYWARENAAFLVEEKPYHVYLPGRYFTYDTLADVIISYIEDPTNAETVEIGCGSGICLVTQAMNGIGRVHGFDMSYGAISFFEDLAEHYKVRDRIEPKQGDFYNTGYENGRFDATFNVGVFEHLKKEDRKRLMGEMLRITKPGGRILVGIPNPESPLNKSSKNKEKNFFQKLPEYIFPWRPSQYSIDLKNLLKEADIEVEKESATLIAPSSVIPSRFLNDEARSLYAKIPKMGAPRKVKELIKFWKIMEQSVATQDELMKVGWYRYIVGRKKS